MEIVNQIVSKEEEKDLLELPNEEVQVEESVEILQEEVTKEDLQEPTNCVALTVRKDYKLVIAKNIAKKGAKMSWKVALSMLVMNFLNTFL